MNKKIITLLVFSVFVDQIQAAEKPRHQQQEFPAPILYKGETYTLNQPQLIQYKQIMRGKDEKLKTTKLQDFFRVIKEDFPDVVQKIEDDLHLNADQEKLPTIALFENLFEEAITASGGNVLEALDHVEQMITGGNEIRPSMARAQIGPDGIQEGICPEHPNEACGCLAVKGHEESQHAECPICRDSLDPKKVDGLSVTPCGHTFHNECLQRALSDKAECPFCRSQLESDEQLAHRLQNEERALAEKETRAHAERQRQVETRAHAERQRQVETRAREQEEEAQTSLALEQVAKLIATEQAARYRRRAAVTAVCCVTAILLHRILKK
jgi:hypothetical protein